MKSYIRRMNDKFLTLKGVSVRIGGSQVLDELNWEIRLGQQWAITGPSGSGKTVLAHTLEGRHFGSGEIHWDRDTKIVVVDQQHRFRNRPGTTELYYQQRFNSADADSTITVAQELAEMTGQDSETGVRRDQEHAGGSGIAEEWLDSLHIRPLLSRPLIQLSNGENKRVQLAIALMEEPGLLILDNPFLGLDVEGRAVLHHIINMLAGKGIQLLLITGAGELPEAITHVAGLEAGKLAFAGTKEEWLERGAVETHPVVNLDPQILEQLRALSAGNSQASFSVAVKMVDVNIHYGEKQILQHISWEVKKGERWNLSGPNGAGKSTMLSLMTGDNPQAYANEIWLFDRRRGTGESIWDIKQRIGFVSPELHLYFDFGATCFDVIASGLFDTIGLFRPLSEDQTAHTLLWMRLLGLEALRGRRLAQLSTGQQRMVLLARALIKNPPMLILDEPCQGLDAEQTAYFRELISQLCEAFDKTLIYVSHYRQELPDCVDKYLRLEQGRMVD